MKMKEMEGALEAVLFTMGQAISLSSLARAVEQDEETARKILHQMKDQYEREERGIRLLELEDSFQLCTKKEYYENLIRVAKEPQKQELSEAALETLSIIAYKQPITKAEIQKIADSTSTVLITGESGTGKEMVATSIWKAGSRSDRKFIALNCAAIPEPLLESELFGYVKGAFTGADPNGRIGKFELANHGIIFLDEIGDMPLYLQAKLLRVLQERKIIRIGSNQVIPIDVRVIAATNKDLKKMIADNKFREDLYYRLNVIPLSIAPLRERKEDIEDLTWFFAARYAGLFGKKFEGIEDKTMEALKNHKWYGNVRELENTLEFMVNMIEQDGILTMNTLPRDFFTEDEEEQEEKEDGAFQAKISSEKDIIPLKDLEKKAIREALDFYGDDTKGKKDAAKALGIGLATLYRKLEE